MPVKSLMMGKINRVLAGDDLDKEYSHLTPPMRTAITEILKTTS